MPRITMPRLSDSMVDGTIVSWLRADGDEIAVGDEIVEIETDKAVMPYQAEHAGALRIVAADGALVGVGELIAYIGSTDEDPVAAAPAGAAASEAHPTPDPRPANAAAPAAAAPGNTRASTNANGRVRASPVARRLAAARGVELSRLQGSGPGGRIVKRDVERVAAAQPPTPQAVERVALTATQATIARRMVEAKRSMPDFNVTMAVDMEAAVALRSQLRESGVEPLPSLGDLVVKACALALREHPRVNASYADGWLKLHSAVNIGVAVAAGDALLVATIHGADELSLGALARESRRLAQRARDGQLTTAEMADATFTVSNLGMFGVSHFTAVLNPPQAAILAVGAVERQVVACGDGFAARHRMSMTLTADHRVIYGADAATFLASVREKLENPLKLLI